MQLTPELARSAARDFARRIADRPEIQSLYSSLEEEAIVMWLEIASLENEGEAELELHELAAEVNDRYPEGARRNYRDYAAHRWSFQY